ncbi:hypothetical protein [Mycobacterium sp. 852002-51057_SCH5723018]|uniref:hypothetical protein n=1 Tax=Mycobacterium sp. 852002-51057_SCH5723018 TaxID=1834094 RepID=UPI0007FB8A08|nr:hypothetical protein [Mycobacterium sp. 852002-51057_SCH5723018]OBG21048.1 hypothetical protein A5764_14715 [Mycobacterium sp. 852002-51057_SCH5723018]
MRSLGGATAVVRRALNRPVTVQALIEFAIWLAVPYIIVGLTWAFIHADKVEELKDQWDQALPAAADIAAFGEATALWPALLLLPATCTGPGS